MVLIGRDDQPWPWGPSMFLLDMPRMKGPSSLFTRSFIRAVFATRSLEIWDTVSVKSNARPTSIYYESGESPSLALLSSKATHLVCRHPSWALCVALMKLGNHRELEQRTMKLWPLLLLWIIKSFVSDPEVSCLWQHLWNRSRLVSL